MLNGHKINISGNFRDIARQINRFQARTGVTAEIHITKGKERLVLKTNRPKLLIIDKAGALAGYFSANKMGVGINKLIEIVGKNKKITPAFVYSRNETKKIERILSGNLSGTNIVYLSALETLQIPQAPQIQLANNNIGDIVEHVMVLDVDDKNEELKESYCFNDEQIRERNTIIEARLLEARQQVAKFITDETVNTLGTKSKKIANNQKELIDSIQNHIVGSDLGETYLRRNSEKLTQGIAENIYSKKSFFSISSTYNLKQNKIDEAVRSAIDTAKISEFSKFADSIIKSFKVSGHTISTTNVNNIKGAVTNGLKKMQNIIFDDFYVDSKRIAK